MYDSKVFLALLPRAGLQVTGLSDGVGRFHTLVECTAAEPEARVDVIAPSPSAIETPALPATGPQVPSWDGVWIVIPAYNEERTIRGLAEAALALCPRVVVVDDGSTDATAAQLDGLALTVLRHPRNQGKAASLQTAFRHALAHDAACVVTLDGDGQHDPRDAPQSPGRLAPPARAPGDRLAAARPLPLSAGTLCGEPLRLFLDLVGRRASDRGLAVGLSRLLERGDAGGHERTGTLRGFTLESEILIEAAHQGHPTLAVTIPGRYPLDARASHYRAVVDTAKIVVMVAGRLLRRGMYPLGLWRSLQRPRCWRYRSARRSTGKAEPEASARQNGRGVCPKGQ